MAKKTASQQSKDTKSKIQEMASWFERVCKADEIHFRREDLESSVQFRTNIAFENAVGCAHNVIIFNQDVVDLFSQIDARACEHKAETAELLMRLNGNERFGRYQLDYDDGRISYDASWEYENIKEDSDLDVMNYIGPSSFDGVIGNALVRVMLGGMSPKDAYDEIQKQEAEEERKEQEAKEAKDEQSNQ